MNLQEFLSRVHYKDDLVCSEKTLCLLHQRNVLSVPFENVDVQKKVPLSLDIEKIY